MKWEHFDLPKEKKERSIQIQGKCKVDREGF